MRRLGKAKRFALLIVAALLGSNLASVSMPVQLLPASATQIASASHAHHDNGCLPAQHASCTAECAALTSCGSMPVLLTARIVVELASPRAIVPAAKLLHLPNSFASLTEPPPPRA